MLTRLPSNHNGGPSLEEDESGDFRIRYMRIHINDWRASTANLLPEQGWLFLKLMMEMYDRGGPLPNDDAYNARLVGFEIRTYRRVLRQLILMGKIHVAQMQPADKGTLFHPRTIREIEQAVLEHKKRRAAALQREEDRRKGARVADEIRPTSGGLPADFRPTSAELPADFQPKSGELLPELSPDLSEKVNEINGCAATTVTTSGPQPSRARAFPKPKPIKKEEERAAPSDAADALQPLVRGSVRWAYNAYNEVANRIGLPLAVALTEARVKAIRVRLKEFGPEGWETALANIERNPFMRGRNDRGWRASLDYVLQAKSYAKLVEGAAGRRDVGLRPAQAADLAKVYEDDQFARDLEKAAALERGDFNQ